jgi:AcrR family transcriptional regulator
VQNVVPATSDTAPLIERTVSRALAPRAEAYTDEVQRLVDAAFTVMRRDDAIDPRVADIVRESGLSNQAFYRHFSGKDELLLAVLDHGRRQLVTTLERRMDAAPDGIGRVRAWIEGVMEQARNTDAAANTRPFAIDGIRLSDRFPSEAATSNEQLLAPLRHAIADAGGDPERDTPAVYELAMGTMNRCVLSREVPSKTDVEHLVQFAIGGLTRSITTRVG